MTTQDRVYAAFAEAFGGLPDLLARAPGRVNLIGEHTDYNDGFVLPMAISGQSLVVARPRPDRQIHVVAADFAGSRDCFALDAPASRNAAAPWSDYVRGMVYAMAAAGHAVQGADLAIAGDVPRGAGLSSSASVSVAIGMAMAAVSGLADLDRTALAKLAQAAECDFVGTRCGIMDQLISARGQRDHALLIDCRTLACTAVPMPPEAAILIVHSGIERGLVDGAYNLRRAQCEAAAMQLGVAALRDVALPDLLAARGQMAPDVFRRARHVVTENARTVAAAEALVAGDLAGLGQLMAASHASMRDDFDITLPAIDALVGLLQDRIGPTGGARMTGGGFGGAVVAMLPKARLDAVIAAVTQHYRTPAGQVPRLLVEQPGQGADWVRCR